MKELKDSNVPLFFLCYCDECQYKMINAIDCDNFHLKGKTPQTFMTGHPTDILDICEFGWYDW